MSVDYRPGYDPADVDSDYGHTGGDITVPTFQGNTKPFKFWCQKALPLVYDDSLSYYEVLCKMADYLNNFMTDLTTVEDSMTEFGEQFVINQQFLNDMADQLGQNVDDLEAYINDRMSDFMTAYTQLQTYVNTYFDNLDVQEEINSKLDEMASDGTLNDLFDPVLETWMQQKTAQIDTAIAGQDAIQAAQNSRISVLEGRMDTFSGLPSGSTSGNAELLDIRTNFLGETYPTAGDAVRASDMIASGFTSIPITRLEDWNGNEASSTYDTIQFDVSAYKGGHVIMIANMESFISTAESIGVGVVATNVSGKTADQNAHEYALTSNVFPSYSVIPTQIAGEERIALFFSIPENFSYQYLKMGYVEEIPNSDYTQPAAIVYANSWSKTQVDPTLTIAGDAADAKAAGDAIDELNERLSDFTYCGKNLFNEQNLLKASGWIVNSGDYYGVLSNLITQFSSSTNGLEIFGDFLANTQYTVSFKCYNADADGTETGNSFKIETYYTDDTSNTIMYVNRKINTFTLKYGTTTASKTVKKICILPVAAITETWHIKEFQIEKSTVNTAFETFYLSAIDEYARDNVDVINSLIYKKATVKWLRGVVNANGVISAGNGAYCILPVSTTYIKLDSGITAHIGLYNLSCEWIGKVNSAYEVDSVSGNWYSFTGQVDISKILTKFNAAYCVVALTDSTITNDALATNNAPSECEVYCYDYSDLEYIPLYFISSLEDGISNAKSDMGSCGKNGFSFIFTTDNHWYHNSGHSPALVKAIQDKTKITDIILGGDLIDGGTNKSEQLELLANVDSYFINPSWYTRYCFGNHDSNKVGQGSATELHFSNAEVYMATQKPQEYEVIYSDDGYVDYYYDDETTKTRVIVVDSKIEGISLYASQTAWFESILASTPSTYKIIVIMHIWKAIGNDSFGLQDAQQGTQIITIVDAWNTAHVSPKVVAMFGGHVHVDANYTTETGVPLILTTCDRMATLADANSAGEQAIDIITVNYASSKINCRRVGRGSDREFNYSIT